MKENPHANHRFRVRKRYREAGFGAFAEHEVLELLLYYCYPRCDTNTIAHKMINAFGSLHNLMDADINDVMERCGVSENTAVLVTMIPSLAGFYMRSKWSQKVPLDNERAAGAFACDLFVDSTAECFYVLSLDSKRRLNHVSMISEGSLTESAVYPREIVSEALRHKASFVVLAHNHPSGSVQPSQHDLDVTRKIVGGLDFIGIKVLDHFITAGEKYYSFAARRQHVAGY
jgi:DNA repair protein RadC